MLSAQRKSKIAQMIKNNGGIRTSELSQIFQVSEMTVLRDLAALEKEGVLQRVYGGAVSKDPLSQELSNEERIRMHSIQKDRIADSACRLIQEGDCIFLDASTTTLSLAKRLYGIKSITVVSNSLGIISEVAKNESIRLICPGGEFSRHSLSFMGPETSEMLAGLNFDKVFFSSTGISRQAGVTEPNPFQANIKKTVLKNAGAAVLLADSSKFDKVTLNKVCPLESIHIIITDSEPDRKYIDFFAKNGIRLIRAGDEAG